MQTSLVLKSTKRRHNKGMVEGEGRGKGEGRDWGRGRVVGKVCVGEGMPSPAGTKMHQNASII
eukprot:COSAG02_NODE_3059_length_7451_cov_11.870919_9_plen_63_part_00